VTTLVSLLIFVLVYWLVVYNPVSLDNLPILPRFER
jgi:predicted secreted protein